MNSLHEGQSLNDTRSA